MKFLVTILLLSIQAVPSQAKTPGGLRQLAAPVIDYFFGDDEEEKELPHGQLQTHRIESMEPDYETQAFTPNLSSTPETITLGPGRDFYSGNNGLILNTTMLDPAPDAENAWEKIYSTPINARQEQNFHKGPKNRCEVIHEAMFEEQTPEAWAKPLQNGEHAKGLRAGQSSLLIPNNLQHMLTGPPNNLLAYHRTDEIIRLMTNSYGAHRYLDLCALVGSKIDEQKNHLHSTPLVLGR